MPDVRRRVSALPLLPLPLLCLLGLLTGLPAPVHAEAARPRAPIDQLLVDRQVRTTGYRVISGSPVSRITDHPAVYRAGFVVTG